VNQLKFIVMKKVILSIAISASLLTATNLQQVNAANNQSAIAIVLDDDGFVDVQLTSLNPAVQASLTTFTTEYDIKSLKYNAEKQLTKVKLVKKDDQSERKVFLDAQGKEVQKDNNKDKQEGTEIRKQQEQEVPSAESFFAAQQDDSYANINFEDLNEKVQQAVQKLIDRYDISSLQYNAEKKLTKVTATSKEDQSVKTVYFDDEGKEVTPETAP
jgi:predicted Zn-dependent protease